MEVSLRRWRLRSARDTLQERGQGIEERESEEWEEGGGLGQVAVGVEEGAATGGFGVCEGEDEAVWPGHGGPVGFWGWREEGRKAVQSMGKGRGKLSEVERSER